MKAAYGILHKERYYTSRQMRSHAAASTRHFAVNKTDFFLQMWWPKGMEAAAALPKISR